MLSAPQCMQQLPLAIPCRSWSAAAKYAVDDVGLRIEMIVPRRFPTAWCAAPPSPGPPMFHQIFTSGTRADCSGSSSSPRTTRCDKRSSSRSPTRSGFPLGPPCRRNSKLPPAPATRPKEGLWQISRRRPQALDAVVDLPKRREISAGVDCLVAQCPDTASPSRLGNMRSIDQHRRSRRYRPAQALVRHHRQGRRRNPPRETPFTR